MKWCFEQNQQQTELLVTIAKNQYDKEVMDLIACLETFGQKGSAILPIKTDDRVVLLALTDIILIDVEGDYLLIETCQGQHRVRERLYRFKEKLPATDFVQVSRQSIININHLKSLEASFSGNLLAILNQNIKTNVSRRYVKALERVLGI